MPSSTARRRVRPRRPGRTLAVAAGLSALAVAGANAVAVARLRAGADAHDPGGAAPEDAPGPEPATVGEGLGPPLRLLVLGDSAARGYGLGEKRTAFPFQAAARLARATGRRVVVSSLATDGHTTGDVLSEQVPLVRAHRPDALVVAVGVNDAVKRRSAADVRADTVELLSRLRDLAPDVPTVLVTCPDLTLAPGLPRPLNRAVGWRCRTVAAAQHAAAAAVEVDAVRLPRARREDYGSDGFHPGEQGSAGMAARAAAALMETHSWISD